ncbi:MAG: rhomboid family intramembrane serine protease [Nibricoccus sp.]
MNGYDTYDEKQPVTWFRGHPIYAAYLVVIVFAVSMVVSSLVMAVGQGRLLNWLTLESPLVLAGEVWRMVTYGLVNIPSISFAFDMLIIFRFGREVEKVVGGRSFLNFFACIYLLPAIVYTLSGFLTPTSLRGEAGALAVFTAFATYYPNVSICFSVLAKWIAAILVGIYVLMALASQNLFWLASILATNGFAYAYVRFQQGRLTLPSFRLPKRQPKFEVLPGGAQSSKGTPSRTSSSAARPVRDTTTAEMDALLDKIARSGMGSLTSEERARLDAAAKTHTQRKYGR